MEPECSGDRDRRQDLARGRFSTTSENYEFLYQTAVFRKLELGALDVEVIQMASRSIAANCRKVVCIGRNYA